MKKVALVGLSKVSGGHVETIPADVEIWTVNQGHLRFPRVNRLFDMHPLELILDPHFYTEKDQAAHWAWLQQPHDYPVYMVRQYPGVPASVEYPLSAAQAIGGAMLQFTSSFCYMAALAFIEGFDHVEIHGFDMLTHEEYAYQREEALKWLAFLKGAGCDIYIVPESGLNERKKILYGYEGIPMVSKQAIEAHRKQYEREYQAANDNLNQWLGVLAERKGRGASTRQEKEALAQVEGYARQAAMNEGAMKALGFLLEQCDMLEVYPSLEGNDNGTQKV